MKDKLCVILKSEYPISVTSHELWNKEVSQDSDTVRETLIDHDIVEIIIPLLMKRAAIIKRVNKTFDAMSPEHTYRTCHIVLNTHGVPGQSDLSNEAIKQVIQNIFLKNITVSQISALECYGMSVLSSTVRYSEGLSMPSYDSIRYRKSHIRNLQHKLHHLITDEPQNFKIYGFTNAYDPIEDRDKVISVLLGRTSTFLSVTTSMPQPLDNHLKQTLLSINVIKETAKRIKNIEYDAAGSLLAIVIDSMKQNILAALKVPSRLQPENALLLEKLRQYAHDKRKEELNSNNFNNTYKGWLKDHKIHSIERLQVFDYYYKSIERLLLSSQSAPGKLGFFARQIPYFRGLHESDAVKSSSYVV